MTTEATGNFHHSGQDDPTARAVWLDLQKSAEITQATKLKTTRLREVPRKFVEEPPVNNNAHVRLPFGIFEQPKKLVKNQSTRDLALIASEMVRKQELKDMDMPGDCLKLVMGCLEEGTALTIQRLDSSDKLEKKLGENQFVASLNSASDAYRRQLVRGAVYSPNGTVVFQTPRR